VVAIGEEGRLAGFALAGVEVCRAEDTTAVQAAWDALSEEVRLLVLTPRAVAALEGRLSEREDLVWVSLPT
jgi:vacuolar-type H+-ATPase subunit F/Vma7